MPDHQRHPSPQSLRALDWLNFFLADVRTGVGPFLAVYLASALHWNPARIGVAMSAMSVGSILAQTPAGAVIDGITRKRLVVVAAAVVVSASCLLMAATDNFYGIVSAQAMAGIAADIFPPAIAALTLGLVGRQHMSLRIGRNEAFNHAGNVAAALLAGVIGSYLIDRGVFYLTAVLAVGSIVSVLLIRANEIDHQLARGCDDGEAGKEKPARLRDLFRDRRLGFFAFAVALFHFANAAMLPQIGQELAEGKRAAPLYMSACIIVAQLVMIPTVVLAGKWAAGWGRKPVFLLGFAVLPVRGVLYTVTTNQNALIAIQVLDGIGAGIFGVVSVLVIADLTQGTGRFNVTQGAVTTAQGIGAALSTLIAGVITSAAGYNAGFLTLAAIALAALLVFSYGVPETKTSHKLLSPAGAWTGSRVERTSGEGALQPAPLGVEAEIHGESVGRGGE